MSNKHLPLRSRLPACPRILSIYLPKHSHAHPGGGVWRRGRQIGKGGFVPIGDGRHGRREGNRRLDTMVGLALV